MMQEMERLQARGEVPLEELKALEEDVTGKVRNSFKDQPPLSNLLL
jgi:hypothetical protein